MVTTPGVAAKNEANDYVYVDWGPEFAVQHGMAFPERSEPGLYVGLGPLGLTYILQAGGGYYFRLGAVRPHVESGGLELVRGAAEFVYTVCAMHADGGGDGALIQTALAGLRHAALAPQAELTRNATPSRARNASPRRQRAKQSADQLRDC